MNDSKTGASRKTGSLKIGAILNGKWVVLEFIGKGGMGEVYRAHQINLKRDVAVKVISKEWISCIEEDEVEVAICRFEREVQAMAGIRHPNVIRIYDCGSEDVEEKGEISGIQYIVMEYIPGNTLRATMSELGFDPDEELAKSWIECYFFPVLDGLEAIHKSDMVHRDVKPENVLMDDQIPKIADFGLVRSCRMKAVTQSIDFKGTVMYMPPEQFMDFRHTDVRGDVYSLGKILYEAVVGKISSKDKMAHFKTVGLDKPESPFFEELDGIIRKATAESRDDRYQSVHELRNALAKAVAMVEKRSVCDSKETPKSTAKPYRYPKWNWIGMIVIVLSMASMFFWHLIRESSSIDPSNRQPTPMVASQNGLARDGETHGAIPLSDVPPQITEDGAMMIHVPGDLSMENGETENRGNVAPFFMDETPVTNHQYVDFLNGVLDEISVQNDVVLGQGSIWLILGEVTKGYEPILYRDGKFLVSHSGHAACPVLRVTAFGAEAYARMYGKRLPTRSEWLHAYQAGKIGSSSSENDKPASFPIPTPVILFEENRFGIRGLNQGIDEWVVVAPSGKDPKEIPEGPEYMVTGKIADENRQAGEISSVKRMPWEAFVRVGFRCVKDYRSKE